MHPRTPLWLIAANLAALVFSIAALAAATMMWIDGEVREMDAYDRPQVISASELEAVTQVRLPAGTIVLTAIRQSIGRGLEYRTWGKLRMPRAALAQFLADSGLPTPRPGERVITDELLPGSDTWHPDAAKDVSGVSDNGRRILVDLDHPADVTIYLYASEL